MLKDPTGIVGLDFDKAQIVNDHKFVPVDIKIKGMVIDSIVQPLSSLAIQALDPCDEQAELPPTLPLAFSQVEEVLKYFALSSKGEVVFKDEKKIKIKDIKRMMDELDHFDEVDIIGATKCGKAPYEAVVMVANMDKY